MDVGERSMAGVGLSVSSGGPEAGDGDGVGSSSWDGWSLYVLDWVGLSMSSGGPGAGDGGGVGSTSWVGGSLYVLDWLGLSMVIGSLRIWVRHVHASLMVEQEKA